MPGTAQDGGLSSGHPTGGSVAQLLPPRPELRAPFCEGELDPQRPEEMGPYKVLLPRLLAGPSSDSFCRRGFCSSVSVLTPRRTHPRPSDFLLPNRTGVFPFPLAPSAGAPLPSSGISPHAVRRGQHPAASTPRPAPRGHRYFWPATFLWGRKLLERSHAQPFSCLPWLLTCTWQS